MWIAMHQRQLMNSRRGSNQAIYITTTLHLEHLERVRELDQQPDQFLALPSDVPYLQLCALMRPGVATSAQAERRLHQLTNQSECQVECQVV